MPRSSSVRSVSSPPRRTRLARTLRFGAALVLASLSMAALCNPTPPVCEAESCKPGQVRACLDNCVTPVKPGHACSLDPCDSRGTCTDGYTCYDVWGDGKGTCMFLGGTFFVAGCELEPFPDQCSNELWCRPGECAADGENRCVYPTDHGGACDMPEEDQRACSKCEPGTECVPVELVSTSGEATEEATCRKRCEEASDCPCNERNPFECTGKELDVPAGFCYHCNHKVGEACDGSNPCCESDLSCGRVRNSTGGFDSVCCKKRGTSCDSVSDCCFPDRCVDGVCAECTPKGQKCSDPGECCYGQHCIEGICGGPGCQPGKECDTGLPGDCGPGHTICDDLGQEICVADDPGKPEICNGKDDDCDGKVDETFPEQGSPCDQLVKPDECIFPPSFSVQGSRVCENGELKCKAKKCDQNTTTNCYCTECGGPCGGCYGNSCSQQNLCGGNLTCEGNPKDCGNVPDSCACQLLEGCPYDEYSCWKPEELGPFPGACIGAEAK